jgi:hypothetical protein
MEAPRASRQTYLGLFLVALATLTYEILLTRIFSVTMYYHFAFVAISVAMFGMTVGALIVYMRPAWFPPERVKTQLAGSATAFAVVMVLSFLTQLSVPFLIHPSVVAAYALAFTYVVVSLPFAVSGVCISLALTRFDRDVSRLYAADLIGAAVGCAALIGILRITDAPTAVLVIATAAALGGFAFALDTPARRLRVLSAVVAAALIAGSAAHTVLVRRQFPVLRILYVKGALEARPLYEKWNSYSRVRVNGDSRRLEPPYGWGLSEAWPRERLVRQLKMDIDVSAGTVMTAYDGRLSEVEHLKYDVTNAGYYIRPGPRVTVIGAGGGRDVLSALAFGAQSVTAIEINDAILSTVNGRFGDFTGHLDRDPRVHFVNDEARSYLARQQETTDVIQISLIDTWAATAAGAFVLSENSLYTVEAWRIFLSRLSPHGILSVSRWYFEDRPGEVYRLVSLASTALLEAGVSDPRSHLMVIRNLRGEVEGGQPEGVGTLLLSPTPFSAEDVTRIQDLAREMRFEVVLSPSAAANETFVQLTSGALHDVVKTFPINIAPPTDDSPFFFQMLRLRDIAHLSLLQSGKNKYNMQAVFVLGVLTMTVVALALGCILFPLFFTTKRDDLRGAGPLAAYFAAIGLGFMLVETSQAQRLIIILGHPAYGLSVVLFALLLSSGIGSYLSQAASASFRPRGMAMLAALAISLVLFGVLTPLTIRHFEGASTQMRIVVAVVILAIPGVFMGMAFPLGMKASGTRENLRPWLWGINGATSVCASVLAVAIALTWTISAAFWTGCACYVLALVAFARATAPAGSASPQAVA